jgi:hypothetical protein
MKKMQGKQEDTNRNSKTRIETQEGLGLDAMQQTEMETVYKGYEEASRSWIICRSTSHEVDPAQGAAAAQAREALETLGGGNPRRPF